MKVVFFSPSSSPFSSSLHSLIFFSFFGNDRCNQLRGKLDESICSSCLSFSWNRSIEVEQWLTREKRRIQIDFLFIVHSFPLVVCRRICLLSFVLHFRNVVKDRYLEFLGVKISADVLSDLVLERTLLEIWNISRYWQTVTAYENLKFCGS